MGLHGLPAGQSGKLTVANVHLVGAPGTAVVSYDAEEEHQAARAAHLGKLSLGDASLEHGGNIAGHETHEVGLDMDILAIRHDRRACSGTNWRASTYDRAATIALIKLIRATDPGHIKVIYFDDPVLIAHGYTRYKVGHDDHIHVRFCEAAHPDARYVCPSG